MGEQIPSEIEVATPNKLLMLLITAYTEAYLHIHIACYGNLALWRCGLLSKKGEESELSDTP